MTQFQRIENRERMAIAKLIEKGFTIAEISRAVGRSKTGIAKEIERYGGRESYTMEKVEADMRALEEARNYKTANLDCHRVIDPAPKTLEDRDDILRRLETMQGQLEMCLYAVRALKHDLIKE